MNKLSLGSAIWIDSENHPLLGKGRIELLKLIDELGSLLQASKKMKMSYKAAWDALKDMNSTSDTILVETSTGGKNGGGSRLTEAGHIYVKIYEKVYEEQKRFFNSLEEHIGDYDKFMRFTGRNSVRTSARNQLKGEIENIIRGDLTSEIAIDIGEGVLLNALITTKSVNELELKRSTTVWAIIKASWIELADENACGENVFNALVHSYEQQGKRAESIVELENSVILTGSFDITSKSMQTGDNIKVFINKSNIILGV
ncbi:MAG: TOBE domain-containing protein [Campylobacteraceae bacterium]|jgi:molybdate transport system regulatory protein|nr:TOBE domain-containing protein [Campylobacteraceae bacterium]